MQEAQTVVGEIPRTSSRRGMLKQAAAAAATIALVSVAGTPLLQVASAETPTTNGAGGAPRKIIYTTSKEDQKGGPITNATGGSLLIGQSNVPSAVGDITRLYCPSSSDLSDRLFAVDNYTTGGANIPTGYKMAIAATTHGPYTGGSTKVGVYASTDDTGGYAVWADGSPLRAVYATTDNPTAAAVYAVADGAGAAGINAISANGIGGYFYGGTANLYLLTHGSAGAPATGGVGYVYVDSNGAIWYCVAPNVWRQLAGSDTAGALHYLPVPNRFADTRSSLGGIAGRIAPNSVKTFTVVNVAGRDAGPVIPPNAIGLVGNITAIGPSGGGLLKVLPGGTSGTIGTSTVNYNAGVTTANSFNVTLGTGANAGKVTIYCGSSDCDFAFDVVGYYL